jgi:phosphate-selective porin OprO/OprP
MPYSLEQLTSSNNIDFIERSFVDQAIPQKEVGLQVFGEPTKGMTYAVALSNGTTAANASATEADVRQSGKDLVGRVTFNLSEAMGDKETVMHGGLAFSHGDSPIGTGLGGNRATEARGASFFTQPVLTNLGTASKTIERTRYGVEGAFATGSFKVQGQYSVLRNEFDVAGTNAGSYDPDLKTYYAEALWTLTGEKWADRYKAGAFGAMKPKVEFNSDNFTGGAWEVGARYSKFDASDFNITGLTGGTASTGTSLNNGLSTNATGFAEAKAYTVGVKFIANPNFRIMADYVRTDYSNKIGNVTVSGKTYDDENAILMRTQIMF